MGKALNLLVHYSFACLNMSKIVSTRIRADGGEYRIRTDDPLLAGKVL